MKQLQQGFNASQQKAGIEKKLGGGGRFELGLHILGTVQVWNHKKGVRTRNLPGACI